MNDLAFTVLPIVGGAVLTTHGLRMAWHELRTGAGSATLADHPRSAQVAAFLLVVFVNAVTVLLGLFLLTIGLFGLMAVLKP